MLLITETIIDHNNFAINYFNVTASPCCEFKLVAARMVKKDKNGVLETIYLGPTYLPGLQGILDGTMNYISVPFGTFSYDCNGQILGTPINVSVSGTALGVAIDFF